MAASRLHRHPGRTPRGDPRELVSSVAGDAIQVADGDLVLLETLRRAGYQPLPSSPFDLDVRLATTAMGDAVELPAGYVVRSASPDDDLVAVHRAAWRPADLPFARGHMPAFSTDATSSFDAAKLAAVQAADGYRADLHVVVAAPDGSLAASCIAWFDPPTGVAAIEPLGVRAEHRNRGLAGRDVPATPRASSATPVVTSWSSTHAATPRTRHRGTPTDASASNRSGAQSLYARPDRPTSTSAVRALRHLVATLATSLCERVVATPGRR